MANMIFDLKKNHMYSWERTEGKSMIDLFLVDQRIRNQVKYMRVFRGSELGTDHYLVVARIRGLFAGWCSYMRCLNLESNYRIRSRKLQDPPIREEYQETVF